MGLEAANIRIFWIPRNNEQLQGRTTNLELSKWITKGSYDKEINASLFIGWPHGAINMTWIRTELEDNKLGYLDGGHYSRLAELCSAVATIYPSIEDDIPF